MDSILEKNDCIIYSFGLAADWTFEDMMDMMGTFSAFKNTFLCYLRFNIIVILISLGRLANKDIEERTISTIHYIKNLKGNLIF